MKDRIGIGIIGTGFARKVQIPAFLSCEGVFIASIASGSMENARAAAAECGATHFTSDWRDTVARGDVDVVCITTPPDLHREMALACVQAEKHIVCEKPMAMNVAEAEEVARAVEGYGKLAVIDHELRFQPGRVLAREMVAGGEIGPIRHAKALFQAPHRGDPNLPWNWWSDAASGGGALGAIGSHIIDSFRWLLGAEVASVFCQLQSHIKERRTAGGEMRKVTSDDQANMLLRFSDGPSTIDTTGIVSLSMTEGPAYRHEIELHGELGALKLAHRGEVYVAQPGESDWNAIDVDQGENIEGVPDTGFARAFRSFAPKIIDAVRGGRSSIENAASFPDGLAVQRVLDAARESNETGCVKNVFPS